MTRYTHWLAAGSIAALSLALVAQQSTAPAPPATQPAAPGTRSAEDIMKELGTQIETNPLVTPPAPPTAPTAPDAPPVPGTEKRPDDRRGLPAVRPTLDPAVIGAAPNTPQPKLRREGEFVVNRRGRISRASSGNQVLFTFEADSQNAAEPPMVLLQSQMLQNMEDLVQERGDQIVFILTGQVTTYRGVNYLMPTMWKLAIDRGNLQK